MKEITNKNNCPLDGFNPCRELECAWYTKLSGKNPQSGKDIEGWGCAVSWMPMLLINVAKESAGTGAAVESFRNEMVSANTATIKLLKGQSL